MSLSVAINPPRGPSPAWPVKRWTTAEFDAMVSRGIIREGSPAFLWDGEIIEPMPENQPHRNAVANLYRLLITHLPVQDWAVDQNGPLALRDGFKPQPDLVVLKGPRSRYDARVPVPADVVILIEVSATSYDVDAGIYLREYAARGVAQYWIVNIPQRRVEVYTDPAREADGSSGYRARTDYTLDQSVPVAGESEGVPFALEGVPVRDILLNSLEPETP